MAAKYNVFDTTPTTYLVNMTKEDKSLNQFIQRFQEICKGFSRRERVPFKHCEENIWLIKPEAANQGRGIEVMRQVKEI